MRLCDQLSNPDADQENGREGCYAAGASAEGLDEVNAADDLFVLFLMDGKSGLAEEKLIGFMLRESCAIDHQANECRNADAPKNSHDMKCVHGVPQKKVMSWSEIPSGVTIE
jgi:hypothetical protein